MIKLITGSIFYYYEVKYNYYKIYFNKKQYFSGNKFNHYKIKLNSRNNYLNKLYKDLEIWKVSQPNNSWYTDLPSTGWNNNPISKNLENDWTIILPSHVITLKNDENLNWNKTYDDKEDTFALHRFGWLLQLLSNNHNQQLPIKGLEWISQWWDSMKNQKHHISWETYSVSERICNFSIFLCAVKNYVILDQTKILYLGNIVHKHLKYLIYNLEYRGVKTNNHILNNARALYLGGRLFDFPFARKFGYEILINETEKLLPNGVLKEGSTHYQLLLTRSFLDIYWVAIQTNDHMMLKWLSPKLRKMIKVCNKIVINNKNKSEIPLIGDISPDFPPSWFLSYPFSINNEIKTGWSRLWDYSKFNFDKLPIDMSELEERNNERTTSIDWVIYEIGRFKLILRPVPGFFQSHSHADEGSFNLFIDEYPVIVDPGSYRFDYLDRKSSKRLSAISHNTITIDNVGVNPSRNSLMSFANLQSKKHLIEMKNGYRLSIKGFRSVGNWINWNRDYLINGDTLLITDYIRSLKNKEISIRYYLDNLIDLDHYDKKIIGINDNFEFLLTIKSKSMETNEEIYSDIIIEKSNVSKTYGNQVSCNLLKKKFIAKGDTIIESVFQLIKPS